MSNCKPVISPMVANKSMMEREKRSEAEELAMVGIPYREAIGALLYLPVRTRPDIAVALCTLAKHVQEPWPMHWEGVKRVLRYLQGTKNEGIVFQIGNNAENLTLTVYADADWDTNPVERYSRTGIVCILNGNAIWCKSHNQNSVATATACSIKL